MQTHLRKRGDAIAEDVTEKKLRELAFDTQRYSGAAIANLVNLAAMRAERDARDKIEFKDLTDVGAACLLTFMIFTSYCHVILCFSLSQSVEQFSYCPVLMFSRPIFSSCAVQLVQLSVHSNLCGP